MKRSAAAVAMSNTGSAESHIRAGRSVEVTQSGKVVALILPFQRTMTDDEEAAQMQPFADQLRLDSLGALEDQDEP